MPSAGSVRASVGIPPATVLDTLVLVNQTLLHGNVLPENASSPDEVAFDSAAGTLYVSSSGGAVTVINASSNRIVDLIPTGESTYGIAYDRANGELYAAHYGTDNVTIIRSTTDQVIRTLGVGKNPAGVTVDPANGMVYVMNSGSNNLTVVDGSTDKVSGAIPVGSQPHFMAVDSTNGELFVTNYGSDTVSVIDPITAKVLGSVSTGPLPGGISFDPANGYLYVADSNPFSPNSPGEVTVIDGSNWTVVTTIGIQFTRGATVGVCPWGIAYDSATKEVYVTDTTCTDDGYVTIINATTNRVASTIRVGAYPFGIVYDPSDRLLYAVNAYTNNLTILNGSTQTVVGSVGSGETPSDIAFDPSNGIAYVADQGGNDVAILNATTGEEIGTITSWFGPDGLAYDAANGFLYVSNSNSDNVSIINTSTERVVGSIPVGSYPLGVTYDPANGDVYVANCLSRNVTVIDGASNSVIGTVGTGECPAQIAYDPANGRLYVTNQGSNVPSGFINGNLTVIDGATNRAIDSIIVGYGPHGVVYDPLNGYIYVANQYYDSTSESNLSVIDGATDRPIGSVLLGVGYTSFVPWGLTVAHGGQEVLVTLSYVNANRVEAVATETNQVLGSVAVGLWPWAVAMDPMTGDAWVANYLSGTISVLNLTGYPPPQYHVIFQESGLTGGTTWAVTFNKTRNNSPSFVVGFSVVTGNYSFTVANVSGYSLLSPASGFLVVGVSNVTVLVRFAQLYSVTFTENGLFFGTPWSVLWKGSALNLTGLTLSVNATNGSYPFSVPPAGGFTPSPANGTVAVRGGNRTVTIVFSAPPPPPPSIRSFTVTPSRIQLGLTVTISVGVMGGSQPLSYSYLGTPAGCHAGNTSEMFCMPSQAGNYTLEVIINDVAGRYASANASFQVNALATQPPPATSSPTLFGLPILEGYGLLAAGIAASAVVVLLVWRRRERPLRDWNKNRERDSPASRERSTGPHR